ncbi:MAG TPA: sugar porter family MFS transporter [Tepidisphaeraceae bacterium]|nr:sugar porter family MFS transporter [Tepidisphaeraceae bacterium]
MERETYNAPYVWAIATAGALGGLLFGYDWVVIGGAKPFFEKYFELNSGAASGWANSCALIGCLVGSIVSGGLSEGIGRKKLLIVSAALFAASSILTGAAETFDWFIAWRITGGVAIGMASNVSPMYIAEISPAAWRGRLVSLNQLTIVIGILAAQIVNLLIAQKVPDGATAEFIRQSWNGQHGWRWMFYAVAIPSMIFLLASMLVPESPRWLVKRGRDEMAAKTLARIGGDEYSRLTLADIQRTFTSTSAIATGPGPASASKIITIGVLLAILQQWCGINVIFNYAEDIYRDAGYGVSDILFNIVITGAINMMFTFVALGTVDRFGRRALMLIGCTGVGLSHLLIGSAYFFGLKGLPVVILTLCAIGCYAMSLAPVTWVLISEIFPNRIRGAAVSISVSALWIACFVLTFTFPVLNTNLGPAKTFWLYAAVCLAGLLFILVAVPETKGKTLEQIELEIG